jgi:hypothetical protein
MGAPGAGPERMHEPPRRTNDGVNRDGYDNDSAEADRCRTRASFHIASAGLDGCRHDTFHVNPIGIEGPTNEPLASRIRAGAQLAQSNLTYQPTVRR